MFQKIKKVRHTNFKPKQMSIHEENGTILTSQEAVLSRWTEYGKKLFTKPDTDKEPILIKNTVKDQEPLPLISKVKESLRKIKCGKSPGD